MRLVPYVLSARKEALGANASIEVALGLGGHDFLLSAISGMATGNFRFNLIPNDTSRRLFYAQLEAITVFTSLSAPTPYRLDGGPYATPDGILATALKVRRSSTITVELLNATAAPNTIQLNLFGFEIFD